MSKSSQGKKPIGKTIVYGLVTAGMYAGVFCFADTIAAYFARGSVWAAGPIATVLLFSYAHGTFAHNLWEALGISALRTRKDVRTITQPVSRPRVRATIDT